MIHVYGILHVLVMKASILCPSIEINRLDLLHAEYPMLALNIINSNGIFSQSLSLSASFFVAEMHNILIQFQSIIYLKKFYNTYILSGPSSEAHKS